MVFCFPTCLAGIYYADILYFHIVSFFAFFPPSLTLCFSFHYRCTRWLQWDYLCLWSDLLWKNTHHGGTVQLNNSKGFLPRRTHMNTHTSFFIFYFYRVSPPVLTLTVHLPPSLSSLTISPYQPSVATNLLYNSLWETTLFLFKSKASQLFFLLLSSLLDSSQGQHLSQSGFTLVLLPRLFFFLVGEPSRPPGNGNHPPDLRGHFRTYIRHGWEPRIPHKGWWEFASLNTHYETFSGNWARALWCNPRMDGLSGVSRASINHDIQTMLILQYLLCSFC